MGSLTVHVVTSNGRPARGRRVSCSFSGGGPLGLGTRSETYTDSDGVARFDRVPAGTVRVFVDGTEGPTRAIGQNDHEDVTVHL